MSTTVSIQLELVGVHYALPDLPDSPVIFKVQVKNFNDPKSKNQLRSAIVAHVQPQGIQDLDGCWYRFVAADAERNYPKGTIALTTWRDKPSAEEGRYWATIEKIPNSKIWNCTLVTRSPEETTPPQKTSYQVTTGPRSAPPDLSQYPAYWTPLYTRKAVRPWRMPDKAYIEDTTMRIAAILMNAIKIYQLAPYPEPPDKRLQAIINYFNYLTLYAAIDQLLYGKLGDWTDDRYDDLKVIYLTINTAVREQRLRNQPEWFPHPKEWPVDAAIIPVMISRAIQPQIDGYLQMVQQQIPGLQIAVEGHLMQRIIDEVSWVYCLLGIAAIPVDEDNYDEASMFRETIIGGVKHLLPASLRTEFGHPYKDYPSISPI